MLATQDTGGDLRRADTVDAPIVSVVSSIFESADTTLWDSTTRSIRIDGTVTSVRLENLFWSILNDVADAEGLQIPQLLTRLAKESQDTGIEPSNFTSFIRVCCGRYMDLRLTLAQKSAPDGGTGTDASAEPLSTTIDSTAQGGESIPFSTQADLTVDSAVDSSDGDGDGDRSVAVGNADTPTRAAREV